MGISFEKLRAFDRSYGPAWEQWEAEANGQRQEFLLRYPRSKLANIGLEEYAIGRQPKTGFCYWAETRTKRWASIQGGTSLKFGLYFGRLGEGTPRQYRSTSAFGRPDATPAQAFKRVRDCLTGLLDAGERRDFDAIDRNPLSQMFKAKLLSMYFPKRYINICSARHLQHYSRLLGRQATGPAEMQHALLDRPAVIPKAWSNWKYTRFLFEAYPLAGESADAPDPEILTRGSASDREPDFEDLQRRLREIGQISEAFAKQWEERRLGDLNVTWAVIDRSRTPSYGFDLETVIDGQVARRIEVKTAQSKAAKGYRFFVTGNELKKSHEHVDNYWFYFVEWDSKKPKRVRAMPARALHELDCLEPAAFVGFINLGA